MKIMMKRSFAVFMTLVMCATMLFGLSFSAQAADSQNTVNYVYSGKYVYNWGEREKEATFLSPKAIEFYSDNNVSLSELLTLSGSNSTSGVPSSALYRELHELMESNHSYTNSYDAVKNLCKYTDCQNSGGKISSFYSGKEIGPEWNSNEWNREHTWPNSKGDKAGNGENDIMMLRPTASSENSSRGNKAYGPETTTQYYNPNDEGDGAYDLRGDVARIILYQYVRWECTNTGSSYNSTGIFGSNGVIQSQDVLLDWIEEDPVDTWELGRNDAVEAITGTRNVFVDYPELAFDLFNEDVPTDYTSPSDGTSVEGTTGTGGSGNTGDNTGDNTTSTPGAEITFELGANGSASHSDGSSKTSYSDTVDGYTLNLTGGSGFYTTARDAKGNSAIKLGAKSSAGSFSVTVPDDVIKVIFNVAGYKTNAAKLTVNGTSHTVSTYSDNGAYTAIEVDTTNTKTINFTTVSGGYRCMIDSITFVVAGSSDDTTDENKDFVKQDGLVISGPSSAFDENVVVTATKLTAGDDFNTAQTALADKASQFTLFDITATVGGSAVQPSGEITITLDIPNGYDPDHVCIAYISDDGTVQELETSAVDKAANTVSATVQHFSLQAVIDTSNVSTDGGDDSGNQGGSTTPVYQKITSIDDLTDGKYLIVYEKSSTEGVIFNGSLATLDAGKNVVDNVAIADSKIAVSSDLENAYFTITKKTGTTYYVVSQSGYSIGSTAAKNQLLTGAATAYTNDISFNADGSANLNGTSRVLRFNSTSGDTNYRFRYYTSGTQQPIALYKYVEGGSSDGDAPETYTITAESSDTSHGTVALSGNVITATAKDGYTLAEGDAAYTVTSGSATVVRDGNTFTVTATSDATITINFVALPTYTATFVANGQTVTTDSTYSGGKITLPAYEGTLAENTVFKGWLAEGETKTLNAGSEYTLTANITFTAQFLTIESGDAEVTEATITFDSTDKRTTLTTEQQIWIENGIIVTNNKTSGSSNVADNVKPARFYKNSELIIAHASPMTQIIVNANTADYAKALVDSISDSNAVATATDKVVTILFGEAVNEFTVILSADQVRVDSMTVYTKESSGDDTPKYSVSFIENGNTISKLYVELGTAITLPNRSSITDEEIVGWLLTGETSPRAPGSTYTVSGNVTFTAQYKVTESGGSGGAATETTATITFDNTSKRTEFTTSIQIWEENGIKVTNNKGSGSNIADYSKPARFYANTNLVVEYSAGTISKIVFDANSSTYATALKNSIGTVSGATVSVSSDKVTVEFSTAVETFTIAKISAQVRMDAITVTALVGGGAAEPVAAIKGAQVSVGSDLSLSYYVDLINIAETDEVVMKVTLDGKTTDINWNKNDKIGGKYIFTFDNIPPQCMTSVITAEIWLNGEILPDATLEYTIQQNAKNLLATYSNDEALKQFIADMLYYGEASQLYRDYKTDNLAATNIGVSLNPQSTISPVAPSFVATPQTNPDATVGDVYFTSATVWFDTTNSIIVKVNSTENATLKVNGTAVEFDGKQFKTDAILATDFADVYTFELYDGDTLIQTLEYSIDAYAYAKYNNSKTQEMKDLAKALYNYGKSAEAYAAAIA